MHIALRVPTSGQLPSRGHNQMQVWARADMPKHSEPCPKCFGDRKGIAGYCQNVRLACMYARSSCHASMSKHQSLTAVAQIPCTLDRCALCFSLRCSQRKRQSCTVWLSVHLASSWTEQDCAISPDLIESPANVGRGVLREKPEVAAGALAVLTS